MADISKNNGIGWIKIWAKEMRLLRIADGYPDCMVHKHVRGRKMRVGRTIVALVINDLKYKGECYG